MSDQNLSLAASAAGVGVIGLLSLPGALSLVSQLRGGHHPAQGEVYEDKDGKSTPEATRAFTTKVPRAIVLLISVVGLGLSVALAVLATLERGSGFVADSWIVVGAWVRKCQRTPP